MTLTREEKDILARAEFLAYCTAQVSTMEYEE